MNTVAFRDDLQSRQAQIEDWLTAFLQVDFPGELGPAMRYSVLGGGKRIRPLFVWLAAEAVGGHAPQIAPAACALELIHVYSLIHDDLPALDNDDWRRGKPSSHVAHGEAIAILAGDALLTYAFELLAQCGSAGVEPERIVMVIREVAAAAGPAGMCGGQILDLAGEHETSVTLTALQHIHRLKTGQLIRVAIRTGAILGGSTPSELEALTTYAEYIGLAFQITDDILDLTGDLATLGKTPRKDVQVHKHTYPSVVGLEQSYVLAQDCLAKALAAIAPLGERGNALVALAQYLAVRQS